jgi:hypothetical protein
MKKVITTISSCVKSLAYSKKVLSVEFVTGSIYNYHNVPRDIASRFAKAKSKGRFLSKNIAGSYESERIK